MGRERDVADNKGARAAAQILFGQQRHRRPIELLRSQINLSVDAFKVAAARVEQSSLRNTLSTCVRTVLELSSSALSTSLLVAPRLMCRSTCPSRGDSTD